MTKPRIAHTVRPATINERDRLAGVLAEAFHRDPLGQWLYPDPAERRTKHTSLFKKVLNDPSPAVVVDTTDGLDAVAVWRSSPLPQSTEPESQPVRRGDKLFATIAKAAPPYPHWYLAFIGTVVSGTGAGAALMQYRLSLIDGPVALWTGNEVNLGFYRLFGFEVLSHHSVEGANAWWLGRAG